MYKIPSFNLTKIHKAALGAFYLGGVVFLATSLYNRIVQDSQKMIAVLLKRIHKNHNDARAYSELADLLLVGGSVTLEDGTLMTQQQLLLKAAGQLRLDAQSLSFVKKLILVFNDSRIVYHCFF